MVLITNVKLLFRCKNNQNFTYLSIDKARCIFENTSKFIHKFLNVFNGLIIWKDNKEIDNLQVCVCLSQRPLWGAFSICWVHLSAHGVSHFQYPSSNWELVLCTVEKGKRRVVGFPNPLALGSRSQELWARGTWLLWQRFYVEPDNVHCVPPFSYSTSHWQMVEYIACGTRLFQRFWYSPSSGLLCVLCASLLIFHPLYIESW